jgi:hypothetical protein
MKKAKPRLWLACASTLAFCALVSASDSSPPVKDRMRWMRSSRLLHAEANVPLPPYLWHPEKTQKLALVATGTGAIAGRVTQAANGAGIEGVDIRAAQLATCPAHGSGTLSDAEGFYVIDSLLPGKYQVCTDNDSVFIRLYWNNKLLWETPDTVVVTANDTTENIDFSFREGGQITGTVTFPEGFSGWGTVNAIDTARRASYSDRFTVMGNSASYVIKKLPTGTYKVKTANYAGCMDVYHDGQSSWADANLVSVTEGATIPSIDFTLNAGGTIEGKVASSSKGPLNDVLVWGYYVPDPEWNNFSMSHGDGDYELIGLRTGYWKIFTFGDTAYSFEWYHNKDTWDNADSVYVAAPGVISDMDFNLEVGGSISGHIYSSEKGPLSGCDVIACERSFLQWGIWNLSVWTKWDTSSAEGSYRITGLRTGDYYVLAYTPCDMIWYDDKPTEDQADFVHVAMPGETSGIDFNLPVSVEHATDQIISIPSEFELSQNYPNPFNPETDIKYTLQKSALVTLEIYNLLGQKIQTLTHEYQPAGSYHLVWHGKNEAGQGVSSGIYLYRLEVNGVSQTKRMVLLK